jgi:hypothetical protein
MRRTDFGYANTVSTVLRARRLHACTLALGALGMSLLSACASSGAIRTNTDTVASASAGSDAAQTFLLGLVRPWPPSTGEHSLAVSSEVSQRVSSYDNALLAIYLLRHGQRPLAGAILSALATLQREDGALPFTFKWPAPEPGNDYVRTGAVAWVGYAAVEYLDSDRGGPARDRVVGLAHRIANFLIDRQFTRDGDPRDGLVLGGEGSFRLEVEAGQLRERYTPGPIDWASTEHNIDAYFFLRDFAKLTGDPRFQRAADRIREALVARGFMAAAGQLVQGFGQTGVDPAYALDCASWGALFLLAAGEPIRAETSLAAAEWRYRSHEPATGVFGHRPYAHAVIIENRALAEHFRGALSASNWDDVKGVWPEGSAGVALAALRLGRRERAQEILSALERLRTPGGGLQTFTAKLPVDFDTLPSLAGTVWIELVRYELERAAETETLWRRR